MRFTLPGADDVELGIYDLNGRFVRRLAEGLLPAGAHQFAWDGRDAQGHEVAHGVYFLRLTSRTTEAAAKIVKLQ